MYNAIIYKFEVFCTIIIDKHAAIFGTLCISGNVYVCVYVFDCNEVISAFYKTAGLRKKKKEEKKKREHFLLSHTSFLSMALLQD